MTERELFKDYYTEEQVAKLLDISVATLRNRHSLHDPKKAPPRGPGRRYLKADFDKWFRAQADTRATRRGA